MSRTVWPVFLIPIVMLGLTPGVHSGEPVPGPSGSAFTKLAMAEDRIDASGQGSRETVNPWSRFDGRAANRCSDADICTTDSFDPPHGCVNTPLGAGRACDMWVANAPVAAIAQLGTTLYIGGCFDWVGPEVGAAVPLDRHTGRLPGRFPRIAGEVSAVVPDGSGGWFVGGNFRDVDGMARSNLAHILADGSVSGWHPEVDGSVSALAVHGGAVYVGGAFMHVGGQPRASLAAIDAATGAVENWTADVSNDDLPGYVYTLSATEGRLFVGGYFSSVGGEPRSSLASIDTATGEVRNWDPGVELEDGSRGSVYSVQAVGDVVYVGGFFATAGGRPRTSLAGIESESGHATEWAPDLQIGGDRGVGIDVLLVARNTIWVGGSFDSIGGKPRQHLAALDRITGRATNWRADADDRVLAIAVTDDTVYVGGYFETIAGEPRLRLAALNRASGELLPLNPVAGGPVMALAVNRQTLYAGGDFPGIGGYLRRGIAALDVTTGEATTWAPQAETPETTTCGGAPGAIVATDTTVYVAGLFTRIGGQSRRYLAALDATTGLATDWDPNPNAPVRGIALDGDILYAAGLFRIVDGQPRTYLAALDAVTGRVTPWDPQPDRPVRAVAVEDGVVYAAGEFTRIGGQARGYLAALDPVSGLATAWNPDPEFHVQALAVKDGTVFIGGDFRHVGGQSRNRLAAIDATTGLVTTWDPNADRTVLALAVADDVVYAGGVFRSIGGHPQERFAALDRTTGQARPWSAQTDQTTLAIAADGDRVYVGGQFRSIGGQPRAHLATLSSD